MARPKERKPKRVRPSMRVVHKLEKENEFIPELEDIQKLEKRWKKFLRKLNIFVKKRSPKEFKTYFEKEKRLTKPRKAKKKTKTKKKKK